MRLIPLFVLALLVCASANAQTPLKNQDVLLLIRSGFGPEVVISKIRQSGGDFDTTPAALRSLKEAGVPETVIVAMINASPTAAAKPAQQETARPGEVLLPGGTRVEIELAYTVSSADLKEGDTISFLVVQPVVVDGHTVIERGAPAKARVVKAEGGKSWARGGQLTWAIQDVTTVDRQRIPLNFTGSTTGNGKAGEMTAGIVVTALLFWPAAPLWGFKHGKPAVVPAGKRYEVFVATDSLVRPGAVRPAAVAAPSIETPGPAERTCLFGGKQIPCKN